MKRFLQLILLTLVAASPAWAANWQPYSGTPRNTSFNGSSYTLTLGFTPPANSMLIAFVGYCCSPTTAAVSDNSSGPADSWSTIGSPSVLGNVLQAWATTVTTGTAPTTVTFTFSASVGGYCSAVYYTGNGAPLVQDGVASTAQGNGQYPSLSYTTGSRAGDLVWALAWPIGSASPSIASPFGFRWGALAGIYVADDGVSSGVAANTQYTASYTLSTSNWYLCILAGFETGSAAYNASLSETDVASDVIARVAGFGRGPSESNTASDVLARSGAFGRSDSEGQTASDALARVAALGRGDSESQAASDVIARVAGLGRGPSESNSGSDTIARQAGFGRSPSESNSAADVIARLAGFGRGASESNASRDGIARSGIFGRGSSENNSASDVIAREAGLGRGASESNPSVDALSRGFAGLRFATEGSTFSDQVLGGVNFGRALPRHGLAVPGHAKAGAAPAREKTGTAPVH